MPLQSQSQSFRSTYYSCSLTEQESFVGFVVHPYEVTEELLDKVLHTSENVISEVLSANSFLIGGYIAEFIPAYHIIYVRELVVNPELKSKSYGKEIFHRIGEIGLEIYSEKFKGIVAACLCQKNNKSFDEKNAYKLRSAINSGGKIIIECAKTKNNFLHFVYISYNGGRENGEIKEVFKKIFKD